MMTKKVTFATSLARMTQPKMAMMVVLGFTAGLPFLLYFSTLSVWLERKEVDVAVIGFFSWFGLSYSLKMFWAPLIDRFVPPGFGLVFGQRRAWILVTQICIACALIGIGLCDPATSLPGLALFSGLLAFSSATQDIVIDAWRIEAADNTDEQTPLAAAYQYGYKAGMIVSGGLALFIAGITNFNVTYVTMGVIMTLAAIMFAIWDSPSGIRAAGLAGIGLLTTSLSVTLGRLGTFFADANHGAKLMGILSDGLMAASALVGAGFIFCVFSGLQERAGTGKFPALALLKGIRFTAITFGLLATVACLLGWLVPPVFTAMFSFAGISLTSANITLIAIIVAGAPFLLCSVFIPWIRHLPQNSRHLRHPAFGAFASFFWRHGWTAMLILCFVSFYRLSDIVMGVMAKPAYSAMGYTPEQIGLTSGLYGVWIVLIGVIAAGFSALHFGLKTSLVIGAIVSVLGNLSFAWMINQSADTLTPIMLAITADNIAGGYAGTVFIAYMSSLVNRSFAGTQYAIFSSIYSLGPKILAGTAGVLVKQFNGYTGFFLFAAALGIPAIILSCFANNMRPDRELTDLPVNKGQKGQTE